MNLLLAEKNAIPLLPEQFQPIVLAKYSDPIKKIGNLSLATEIRNMVVIAHAELGLNIDSKDDVISFMVDTLLKDLRAPKYATISIELVKLFVKNGVRGDYGTFKNQMNIVNIQNIHYWINEGLKSETYKKAISEYNEILKKETEPVPVIDKILFSKSACIKAFEHYKMFKTAPFAAFAYYDIINELIGFEYNGIKTLLTDQELRKKITMETKQSYTESMLFNKNKAEKRGNYSLAESIMHDVSNEFKGQKGFENILKEKFLCAFFDQLINQNKNLEL